jgi:hypothetical protein
VAVAHPAMGGCGQKFSIYSSRFFLNHSAFLGQFFGVKFEAKKDSRNAQNKKRQE